jgi:hypothetical protein
MADKLILTNAAVLRRKYGAAGVTAVKAAITGLIAADRRRGLVTRLIDISGATAMRRLSAPPVLDPTSAAQNKLAIDRVFAALKPVYMMLLGSRDVIPHQDLVNPVLEQDPTDDPVAWSDLPYACAAPYSRQVADFIDPSRVVARLPDLTGAREPSHLLRLLKTATRWHKRARADYAPCFALSARSWRDSTARSLRSIFGNADTLRLCPPTTGGRARGQLGALSHFINCHGGLADPQFYGQHFSLQPVAFTSAQTRRRLREGTVAAMECCYGADLYDSDDLHLDLPICQSYLAHGAYGYFGSTTVAYGPAKGTEQADVITQAFFRAVLAGRSLGGAALEARQHYCSNAHELDPIDLKTLAQFCLYGDPSVHPVRAATSTGGTREVVDEDAERSARLARRDRAREFSTEIRLTKPIAALADFKAQMPRELREQLYEIAREAGIREPPDFTAYNVTLPRGFAERALTREAPADRYHLAIIVRPDLRIGSRTVIVARESGGRVLGYRIYYQR